MPDPGARARLLAARQQAAAQAVAAESAFHQARILLLIDAFSGRRRGLRGMSRLSRLDFLLRFPPVLDHMDPASSNGWPTAATTTPAERHATDLAFASSRYGLWTDRYTLIIGALLGKQLTVFVPGQSLELIATQAGRVAAKQLGGAQEWLSTKLRADFLHQRLDISASRLDQFLRPAIARMEANVLKATA